MGAQKIKDLSESKIFFAEVFQITSRFVLVRKKFGVRCTLIIIFLSGGQVKHFPF